MLRNASIAHRVPGRIRITIPSAKADREFLEQARAALAALPGVLEVSANPLTGSLVVLHGPGGEAELEGAMSSHNGSALPFVLSAAKPPAARRRRTRRSKAPRQSYVARSIAETVADLDDIVREASGNAVDLKILLPLAAAAMGITMLGTPRRTPVWMTLLIFAFSSFMSLHSEGGVEQSDEEISSE